MAADPSAGDAAQHIGHGVAPSAGHNPLDNPFHHVVDANAFDIPLLGTVELPSIPFLPSVDALFQGHFEPFQLTKFMVLQLLAATIALLIFVPLARKIQHGGLAAGRFWGFWEAMCLFLRDDLVRPTIGDPNTHNDDFSGTDHVDSGAEPSGQFDRGHSDKLREMNFVNDHAIHTELPVHELGGHPADKFLPLAWSFFFYILICNLLGMVPGMGSPTASISVTGALALFAFGSTLYIGMKASGVAGYWANLVPQMELAKPLKMVMVVMLWPIELFSLLIKHSVLAIRLFANIMGGHTVLFVLLAFIAVASNAWLASPDVGSFTGWTMYGLIAASSVAGQVFISLLELMIAFLHAFVFACLAIVFISAAVHPH